MKLTQIRTSRQAMCGALWRQIAAVVRLYVQQTDSRRMHFAELRRLDAESAVEIVENEERISDKEKLIIILQKDHENILSERESKIKELELGLEHLNKSFLKSKQNLQRDLQTDEKKLCLVSECASKSVKYLQNLTKKGEFIKNLANTCKKMETEREKISKWLPNLDKIEKYEGDVLDLIHTSKIVSKHLKHIGSLEEATQSYVVPDLKLPEDTARRPKTAASIPKSTHSISTITPESRRITTIGTITIQAKDSPCKRSTPSSSPESESLAPSGTCESIVERCFETLKRMENFWLVLNKVELDYIEIKEEKRMLEKENKQLRGMIRAVLEAAALSKSASTSRVSTRLPSKRRSVQSAPLRRVLFT